MPIIYSYRPKKSKKSIDNTKSLGFGRRIFGGFIYLSLAIILGWFSLVGVSFAGSVPSLEPETRVMKSPGQQVRLAWPNYGQAAVGAVGHGVLESNGVDKPRPIASITKVVTAMTVLQKYPLAMSEQGPNILITEEDVLRYEEYFDKGGSVVRVKSGQPLTQYQATQALLMSSANNIADTMAIWAFGSMDEYRIQANNFITSLGMQSTQIDDASGFSPKSVSTATDLIVLGEAAMKHPVVSDIVGQSSAEIPVAGIINNTNKILGGDKIAGIKTGNTDEAGGCFLGAMKFDNAGQTVVVVTAVLGASNVIQALRDSESLLYSAESGFGERGIIDSQNSVGYFNVAWGDPVGIVTESELKVFGWLGKSYEPQIKIDSQKVPIDSAQKLGSVSVRSGAKEYSVNLKSRTSVEPPSFSWRVRQSLGTALWWL